MYCSQCGKEIPNNSKFCNECGSPIAQDDLPFDFEAFDAAYKEKTIKKQRKQENHLGV